MQRLVQDLIEQGVLNSPHITAAFSHIDRADFVPKDKNFYAYRNEPLPIGHGQTISQPWTVAFMLELLNPLPGNKILDVGSGSGWQTALLSYIVSHDKNGGLLPEEDRGRVIGLEIIPELVTQSILNISKYRFVHDGIAEIRCRNACDGYVKEAPYDRIVAGAATKQIPKAWKEQLVSGGRIVTPVNSSIVVLQKKGESFREEVYKGFAFVPFVSPEGESDIR